MSNLAVYGLIGTLAVGSGVAAYRGLPETPPPSPPPVEEPESTTPSDSTMMSTGNAECDQMMNDHRQLMTDLDRYDQELNQLVTTMQSATGSAKLDATARVVETLVAQRKQIRDRVMSTHHQTISHLLTRTDGQQSLSDCPIFSSLPQSTAPQTTTPDGDVPVQDDGYQPDEPRSQPQPQR